MISCPKCSSQTPDDSRFCPSCATPLDTAPDMTQTSVPSLTPPSTPVSSMPSLDKARFLPGTMVAGRYRVIGLLGRGGMGEVYRADDLKLGQPVALKFLPRALEKDPSRQTRFLNEVKLARQVSHPNVCRVYDVGEAEGQTYLSMEYVDGEDLASLLRRIGRLPKDRAVRMARQLCAGLAAAHEQGILHRDLKPANVMIDGRGRAKITDFGLASIAETIEGAEARAGTPGYMAPEQVEGKEVTVRSDIYSLGLVLYELFTGEQAFKAQSLAELARMQRETMPTSPSSHVDGFDPAVERIILRCLDKEPARRPGSALALAAALPGGDPLAAALAAGETPSPELVAAAGEKVGLKGWIAWSCLAVIAVSLPVAVMLIDRVMLIGSVPMELTPPVLQLKAQEIIAAVGYTDRPADTAHGFSYDGVYLDYLRENAEDDEWPERLADSPPAIRYWYRQSPQTIVQSVPFTRRVSVSDPPAIVPGMIQVELDPRGRLLHLSRVPTNAQADAELGDDATADWASLFTAAGLEIDKFDEVPPTGAPPVFADRRIAWEGAYPARPDLPIRIQAAELRGQPVDFRLVGSWIEQDDGPGGGPGIVGWIIFAIVVLVLGVALMLARYNVRQGRSDRRGALRMAIAFFVVEIASWLLEARHVSSGDEIGLFMATVVQWFAFAALVWALYLAIEPLIRRRWPDLLVSWTRLLDGRFRDPLVGRDLLIGATLAVPLLLLDELTALAPSWAGGAVQYATPPLWHLEGGRLIAGGLLGWGVTLWPVLIMLLLLVLFRMLFKRNWAALLVTWIVWSVLSIGGPQGGLTTLATAAMFWALFLFVLTRFGLLAAMAALYLHAPLAHGLTTGGLGAWYADYTIGALILLLAVALYGFWVSLAGRPIFGEHAFEDN